MVKKMELRNPKVELYGSSVRDFRDIKARRWEPFYIFCARFSMNIFRETTRSDILYFEIYCIIAVGVSLRHRNPDRMFHSCRLNSLLVISFFINDPLCVTERKINHIYRKSLLTLINIL